MDVDEKFQAYLNQNNFYRFEGESGVRNIETIARDIGGYDDIREFLADNPAACEGLVQFIQEWTSSNNEWQEALDGLVEESEDENDGQPDEAQEWHDFDPDA